MSFQKAHVSETGLSDYHKLITTFFKTFFSPKTQSFKLQKLQGFIESKFLNDLNKIIISFDNENPNQNYNILNNRFLEVVNVHAPLKTKIVRGNDTPFVDKQLRKAIYTRTRLKNKIHKNPPFDGTHLVAVRGLITKRYPLKCVNGKSWSERRYFVR